MRLDDVPCRSVVWRNAREAHGMRLRQASHDDDEHNGESGAVRAIRKRIASLLVLGTAWVLPSVRFTLKVSASTRIQRVLVHIREPVLVESRSMNFLSARKVGKVNAVAARAM